MINHLVADGGRGGGKRAWQSPVCSTICPRERLEDTLFRGAIQSVTFDAKSFVTQ